LQRIHSTTVNTASTLESSLQAAEQKISSLNREISGFNQERARLLTSKLHLEDNLSSLNKNYDLISAKLAESQRMERAAVEKSVKLEDKLEFQQSHLVSHQ
jgi:predicted  nucleic acid-binding Zn-ribbon protein